MKKKTVTSTFQQGDCIGRRIDQLPPGERKVISKGRCVLAHGESGHSHVVDCEEAELIQIGERMLLVLARATTLNHEEHRTITLSPGIWDIGRVQEYDYLSQLSRPVQD